MKITDYDKELKIQEKEAVGYKLTGDDKKAYKFFQERKEELQIYRRNTGIEEIWRAADKAYQPHQTTLGSRDKKAVLVSDDELGWRSTKQVLGTDDEWMEDSVAPNPYVKIQTALGIIVDRNPAAVLKPGTKKYKANTELIRNLYERNWKIAHSKTTLLKPFVFNQAKYGLGVGRTYPLRINRLCDDLVEFSPDGKNKYKEVDFTYYDDVFRESISPWQCWFDDGGITGNPFSFNDNLWFKDYSWLKFKANFSRFQNFKYVTPSNKVLYQFGQDAERKEPVSEPKSISKTQIRVWFYENLELDRLFVVTDDGVVLINDSLPQKPKNKHLSLYTAPWTLRDDKTIYGIGVYEAMRGDYKLHTKIRQMTMDQLVLSIYKEFFYEGTETLQGSGVMKIIPGRGRQVVNPQNVKWNEIPGPGAEAWAALDRQEVKMEEDTGITRNLTGEIVGKTAYETAQARESALKRLKTPLENLTDALEIDALITVQVMEDLYSVPKIKLLADNRYIEAFELEGMKDENGNLPQFVEEYREYPLEVQIKEKTSLNEEGTIQPSKKTEFIKLKPEYLPWEGTIEISGESVISDSEILDRITTLEMSNIVIPLLGLPPQTVKKAAIQIIETYKKDPKDWLPDSWFQEQQTPDKPLFIQNQEQLTNLTAPKVTSENNLPDMTTPTESFNQSFK
jgi:hypothetical protein